MPIIDSQTRGYAIDTLWTPNAASQCCAALLAIFVVNGTAPYATYLLIKTILYSIVKS